MLEQLYKNVGSIDVRFFKYVVIRFELVTKVYEFIV